MIGAIFQGFIFGMALCFSLGPAFFGLIQVSLKHGYRSGIAMAIGIFTSDLLYLLLAYFGISSILMDQKYSIILGLAGGTLLIGYGIYQAVKKPVVQTNEDGEIIPGATPSNGAMALKGFLMNLLNPFVIVLWISAITFASTRFNQVSSHMLVFFVATLATVLGTDILKSLASHKLKQYINPNMVLQVNRIAGIIFIISGVVLIVRVFVEQPWLKG